jgi:hypothetical protein
MDGLILFLIFAGIILLIALMETTSKPTYIKNHKCHKNPELDCPLKVQITDGGGMAAEGHFKCCRVISRIKAMNEAFCYMKPGVSYNGISISQSVHEQALRDREEYEKLDDSGPSS